MWTEDIAGKGSLEVGSSFHTFAELLERNIDHLTVWSDSCSIIVLQQIIFKKKLTWGYRLLFWM